MIASKSRIGIHMTQGHCRAKILSPPHAGKQINSHTRLHIYNQQKRKCFHDQTVLKAPGHARGLHVCSARGTKTRQVWQCDNCRETSQQWTGKCQDCGEWNTMHKVEIVDESAKAGKGGGGGSAAVRDALSYTNGSSKTPFPRPRQDSLRETMRPLRGAWTTNAPSPQRLSDVLKQGSGFTWRLPLAGPTGAEVSRVLGGGIVPGSLTLFSGDPGIGKSTMLLQMADLMASISLEATEGAEPGSPMKESDAVLYITAEESVDQVSNRADRMGLENAQDNIYLYSAVQMSQILRTIVTMQPRAVIVDSIQTVYLEDVTGSAGSVSQIRECTTALMRVAKDQRIPIFIVGHVTKAGEVAGPKVLEHIVDTTLYMEGEHGQTFRLLRVNKNRFGKTDEIGVFSMDESGLQPVPNPSAFFLTDRSKPQGASSAISVTMGGSRPMLVEIQALCTPFQPGQGAPLRAQNGVQKARMYQILAILQKYCKLSTYTFHIHTNVVGGFILNEPATDLAVAIAIASSIRDRPVRNDLAFVGEIGLGGELRPISNLERRVAEALKLGFTSCVVPQGSPKLSEKRFQGIEIIQCANINDAIRVSLT